MSWSFIHINQEQTGNLYVLGGNYLSLKRNVLRLLRKMSIDFYTQMSDFRQTSAATAMPRMPWAQTNPNRPKTQNSLRLSNWVHRTGHSVRCLPPPAPRGRPHRFVSYGQWPHASSTPTRCLPHPCSRNRSTGRDLSEKIIDDLKEVDWLTWHTEEDPVELSQGVAILLFLLLQIHQTDPSLFGYGSSCFGQWLLL